MHWQAPLEHWPFPLQVWSLQKSQAWELHVEAVAGASPSAASHSAIGAVLPSEVMHWTSRVAVPPPHSAEHSPQSPMDQACTMHGAVLQAFARTGGSKAAHAAGSAAAPSTMHCAPLACSPPSHLALQRLHAASGCQ